MIRPAPAIGAVAIRSFTPRMLDGGIQELRALALRRRAVGIDDQVLIPVIDRLERGTGLDADHTADGHVLAHRRLAEVHREGPREHYERLRLKRMAGSATLGAGG